MIYSPFYTCKGFRPVLNSLRCNWFKKSIICENGNRPVLNSPIDNDGERSENKTGAYISLYTVVLQARINVLMVYWVKHMTLRKTIRNTSSYMFCVKVTSISRHGINITLHFSLLFIDVNRWHKRLFIP